MAVQLFNARLADSQRVGGDYLFLKLELIQPHRIEFTAGQYILLNTPNTAQKRQYSIVSAPRLDHAIELLVEVIPSGVASSYLASLHPGDDVSFYAPAGEFVIAENVQSRHDPLVFVGTGSGIAPLRSMILDQLRTRETTRPLHLIWGMRYAESLFWLDQFDELQDNFSNFSYHIVLSKAPDEWTLCRGRVTDCLSTHDLLPNAQYYMCGNPHMIEDVTAVLQSRGVPADHLHHEKFTPAS